MMVYLPLGAVGPLQPKSSKAIVILLVVVACVFSVVRVYSVCYMAV